MPDMFVIGATIRTSRGSLSVPRACQWAKFLAKMAIPGAQTPLVIAFFGENFKQVMPSDYDKTLGYPIQFSYIDEDAIIEYSPHLPAIMRQLKAVNYDYERLKRAFPVTGHHCKINYVDVPDIA